MTLNELMDFQKEFDSRHEGNFKWDTKVSDENLEFLEFLVIALMGEVGETANIIKKILRGDFKLSEKKEDLEEEISDIFAYLLKLSYQMDIDMESTYLKKMKINEERFKKYEK